MACVAGFDGKKFFFRGDGEEKQQTLLKLSGKCGNMEAERFQHILANNMKSRGAGNQAMSFAMMLLQIIGAQWKAKRPFLVLKLGGNILDDLIADLSDTMEMIQPGSQMDAIQVWDPLRILVKSYDAIIFDDVTARNALGPHHFEILPKLLREDGSFFLLTDRQPMKDQMKKDFSQIQEFRIDGALVLSVARRQKNASEKHK